MSAGGREDRGVRMLGSGRPFIINPLIRGVEDIKNVEKIINQSTPLIMVKDLGICDKSYYQVLKKYEDSKTKFYTCLVWTEKILTALDVEKINSVTDLSLIQKTPIRVMHRRALMDRKKTIFKLEASQINENFMVII
jgi:tRNA pseudouridine synthase 10